MDLPEILLTIAGVGLLLGAIGMGVYLSKGNESFHNFTRVSNKKTVVAVYSEDGKMRFERYDPIRHPLHNLHEQTIGDNRIIHVSDPYITHASEDINHANALRATRQALSDTIETANTEYEQSQENVQEKQEPKKICIPQPGDRFKGII
jgi:hypothetical protein